MIHQLYLQELTTGSQGNQSSHAMLKLCTDENILDVSVYLLLQTIQFLLFPPEISFQKTHFHLHRHWPFTNTNILKHHAALFRNHLYRSQLASSAPSSTLEDQRKICGQCRLFQGTQKCTCQINMTQFLI